MAKSVFSIICYSTDVKPCVYVAISDITPWLVFTNRYYIRELSLDGENYRRIAQGFDNVVALDFHIATERIFFRLAPSLSPFQRHA